MGRLAGSSQGPWVSPPVGCCPQTWVRGMLRVGAPGWLRMHTRALSQHPAQWMAVLCLSSSAHSVPAPSLPPDWSLQTSVSSGWDPDVPTWIRSPGHKGRLCLYSGTVFITDVPWIKDTASPWEGVIQTELIIAVITYKYSCVCSVKKAKQIKYFWSCSIACRLLTRHRSQNNNAGNLMWSGIHFSSTSNIVQPQWLSSAFLAEIISHRSRELNLLHNSDWVWFKR